MVIGITSLRIIVFGKIICEAPLTPLPGIEAFVSSSFSAVSNNFGCINKKNTTPSKDSNETTAPARAGFRQRQYF